MNKTAKYIKPKKSGGKTKKLPIVTKKLHPRRRPKRIELGPSAAFWMLLGIAAVVLLPYLIHRKTGDTGDSLPSSFKGSYCVDISHHNPGDIQWDSLRIFTTASGRTCRKLPAGGDIHLVHGVILKATEGVEMKDRRFAQRWSEAADAPVRRGAYHFFRTSTDPALQAANYCETVGDLRHSDFPPILDVETIHKGCSHKQLNDKVLTWLKAVEDRYGRKPVVYTSASFAVDILDTAITRHYPVWVAHYRAEKPRYASDWVMWQFTDRAVVHGIKGKVDLSVIPEQIDF